MERKGIATWIMALIAIVAVAGAISGVIMLQPAVVKPVPKPEYTGEFTDVAVPDDVGTDLVEGRLIDVTGEGNSTGLIGWNLTGDNGTTTTINTSNTPIVDDRSYTTVYVNGTNTNNLGKINWSIEDSQNGVINVTLAVDICYNISATQAQCNATVDYRYQNNVTAYNETSDTQFEAKFVTEQTLSKAHKYFLAFKFDIDDDVESLEADGTIGNTTVEVKEVYVIKDSSESHLDPDDALYAGSVDSNQEDFDLDIDEPLAEDDYVLVIEVEPTAVVGSGATLFDTITMDVEGNDLDSGDISVYVRA